MKRVRHIPNGMVLEVPDEVAEGLLVKPEFELAAEDDKPKRQPRKAAAAKSDDE